MRIAEIEFQNFLSHRRLHIDVRPDANVLLVAGANGAGKTALAEGIRLAMTGALQRGQAYKKDLANLITQGEKTGYVAVADEDGTSWRTLLASGSTAANTADYVPRASYALDPSTFLSLSGPDRRKMLFQMAGMKVKAETVIADLVEQNHSKVHVEAIGDHLGAGFDKASTRAKALASEARGSWKATTGETHGSTKGETWKAQVQPLSNAMSREDLVKEVEEYTAHLSQLNTTMDIHRVTANTLRAAQAATELAAKGPEWAAELEGLEAKLPTAKATLDRIQLEYDNAQGTTAPCPCCKAILGIRPGGILVDYEKVKPSKPGPDLFKDLKVARSEVEDLEKRIRSVRSNKDRAEGAAATVKDLPKAPDPQELDKLEKAIAHAKAKLHMSKAELDNMDNHATLVEEAKKVTDDAHGYHEDILAFEALADALLVLPAKYLGEAISTINEVLKAASENLGAPVQLGEDMEPRYGTIPYSQASDSQQWRVRCALGFAMARNTGYPLLMDAFDVIQPSDRGQILEWLSSQDDVQVILCATLKGPPPLQGAFQVEWIA